MLQEREYNFRMNLNNCEIAENLFRKRVQQKILDREISTKKITGSIKVKMGNENWGKSSTRARYGI